LSLQTACSSAHLEDGDFFFVRNKGAVMPVWVKGNTSSGVFLINLHGGPGGSSIVGTIVPAMQDLENEFAVVYWDQRASGLSQGNPSPTTFTVEQYVEDTDLVVDTLAELYAPTSVFLYGHSWGGALGAAYLTDTDRQAKITGYIDIASGHNLVAGLPKSVIWLREYATEQIALGNEAEHWQNVFDWCDSAPDMTVPDNYFKLVEYRQGSNDVTYDPDSAGSFGPDSEFVFLSPMSFAVFFNEGNLGSQFNILELNLSADMANIVLPSIVLWGRHDGRNTAEMGQDAYDSLGTQSADKTLVFFENSAHQPFLEEQDLFVAEVTNFVERYR
jgi:proline iminopeptidase